MKKDNVGGSAEVFRTVGEKWKGLTEESKKEYRKKALEAGDNIPLSSNKEQALKIMKNMMKEVAELESLGGQCMVLCSYDGMLYHNESAICEKLIADKDLISSFGSLLHLSDKEKKDVCPKDLQEVFNNKYSILVEKKGQKMPYTRAKQLGIVFQNLPDTLAEEIGLDPRKPHLYGGAQRRKLWLSRDTWKLSISDAVIQSSSSTSIDSSSSSISTSEINPTTSLVTPAHTITTPSSTIIIPANTIITASSTPTFPPASSITSPGNHTYKPNTISTPINTTTTWSTTFTPSITLSSLHTTSITSPSKPISSPRTIITPSPTFFTAPSTCTSPPAAIVTSTTSPDSTTTTSLSTSSSLLVAASVPSSYSQPVTSSAGRSLLSMSCSTSGTIISKDTRFGMTVRENGEVHAVCTLCSRQQVHGRNITPGNVVVNVLQILKPGVRPLFPGKFDEDKPLCVGGFYEWPSSHLVLM